MAATFTDINAVANDGDLLTRVAACAGTKDIGGVDPNSWAQQHRWDIVNYNHDGDGTIADSYQYAEDTKTINVNPRTGQRTDTILDSVIEAAVDSILAATPAE